MDNFTKGVLSAIAVSLFAIAVKMWMPGYATMGEIQAAMQQPEGPERQRALAEWRGRLVMLRVQGGTIDVDVTSAPIR